MEQRPNVTLWLGVEGGGKKDLQFLKQSTRERPRLSLILLDWGVRESFHLLHYLRKSDD